MALEQLPEGVRGYNGSTLLKTTGQKIKWTPHMLSEYLKCKEDPVYFAGKYMRIVSLDHGVIPFKMWDFQKEIVNTVLKNRFTIIATGRQQGKTQTCCAFVLHYILFNANKTVAILANKGATSREILSRIQSSYELLPSWLQQGVKEFNKGSMFLENGSRVFASATSSSSIRGYTIDLTVFDEAAFVENWESFYTSTFPTISSGSNTKVVMISTPNGLNHFYKFWIDALEGRNDYVPIKADWTKVPGRTQEWADKMRRAIGSDERFLQEFCVEFAGSQDTLIPGSILKKIIYKIAIEKSPELGLHIYEKPVVGHRYIMTVDVARGTGRDNTAFSVFDVSVMPYKQVAVLYNNTMFPTETATTINNIGKMYNYAYVLVELNDLGQQVSDILFHTYEYENLFSSAPNGRDGMVLSLKPYKGTFGIKTTESTRRVGLGHLRTHMISGKIEISDYQTLSELGTFKKKGTSTKYEAETGHKDDLVITLMLFSWLIEQPMFIDDYAGQKVSYDDRIKMIEENMLPFGGSFDGVSDPELVWNWHPNQYLG